MVMSDFAGQKGRLAKSVAKKKKGRVLNEPGLRGVNVPEVPPWHQVAPIIPGIPTKPGIPGSILHPVLQAIAAANAAGDDGGDGPAPWDGNYGTEGWDPSGQNIYNSALARGDMAMPASWGGLGILDTFGGPGHIFWRRDWADPSHPGGKVKGEN